MADKFIFIMQVMFLGLLVVMLVLFALYGLMVLFNNLFSRMPAKKKNQPAAPKEDMPATVKPTAEGLPPQIVAAISAALYCCRPQREAHAANVSCERFWEKGLNMDGSRWLAAARRDLLENRELLEISRRERN